MLVAKMKTEKQILDKIAELKDKKVYNRYPMQSWLSIKVLEWVLKND